MNVLLLKSEDGSTRTGVVQRARVTEGRLGTRSLGPFCTSQERGQLRSTGACSVTYVVLGKLHSIPEYSTARKPWEVHPLLEMI